MYNPIYLWILFQWAIKSWALRINKYEKVHDWKKQNKPSQKNLKIFFSRTIKILKGIFSQHNSMAELCRTLFKYENKREMGGYNWLKTS